MQMASYAPDHFNWQMNGRVAIISLKGAARKNPLTFASYAQLRDCFRDIAQAEDVKAVVFVSHAGNFCSGGDVRDIIGPLLQKNHDELLAFTRMTGDVVQAIRECGRPVIAAVEGVCVGAGAVLALAADIRFASLSARTAFLFARMGLSGCDMGAGALLPRLIGEGRARELLFSGRTLSIEEGLSWGFYNRVLPAEELLSTAIEYAQELAAGPTFAHKVTKETLNREWTMTLAEALEAEARAQARCMQTKDFRRAYQAFLAGETPDFQGD